MTDLKTLKQLIRLMVDNDLTELDVEGQGEKVKLKRGGPNAAPTVQYVAPPMHAPHPSALAAPHGGDPATSGAAAAPAAEGTPINSPMVGTFYSAASPDARPFVAAGDSVTPDTVVCIIEAMKVFNEIKAEASGVVQKVLVENGQSVEFGQPLFLIKPA